MNALWILAATATLGIDIGTEKLDGGGYEYIIQIEPQLVGNLLKGQDVVSEVPLGMDVRKYRITVGTNKLRHEFDEASDEGSPAEPAENSSDPAIQLSTDEQGTLDQKARKAIAAKARSANERPKLAVGDAAPPETFEPDPATGSIRNKPITDRAVRTAATGRDNYDDVDDEPKQSAKKKGARTTDAKSKLTDGEETRPWSALVATVIALFVSLGANVYLGWTAWSARVRYRDLLEQYQLERSAV